MNEAKELLQGRGERKGKTREKGLSARLSRATCMYT
jgi:hypothetical protein